MILWRAIGRNHHANGIVFVPLCLMNLGTCQTEFNRHLEVIRPLPIGRPSEEIANGHTGRQRQVQSFRLRLHTGDPGEPIGIGIPARLGETHEETQSTSSMCSPIQANALYGAQQMLVRLTQPHEIQQQRLYRLNHGFP